MFLEVSATLLGMDEEGRRRAGSAVADVMSRRGWNAVDLADAAEISDPATIRTFLAGDSWPWFTTRGRIERALGIEPGSLERIAKGRPAEDEPGEDDVVAAIGRTSLSRADKAALVSHYFRLVDGDQRPDSDTAQA